MTGALEVVAISGYLERRGWWSQQIGSRGATVWTHETGCEVLVPARDRMSDSELRIRQLVAAVAEVEGRTADEVALAIHAPADELLVRTCPQDTPNGVNPLTSALRELKSLGGAFTATARALEEGSHVAFKGRVSNKIVHFVDRVQIGAAKPGSYVLPVRVPVDDFGRRVLVLMHEVFSAVRDAAERSDPAAFGETVVTGVSADLCEALSGFAGENRLRPFDFGFHWVGGGTELPVAPVRFAEGTGEVIRSAADYLRKATTFGELSVTGVVERLDAEGRRVQVRDERHHRAVWVRLADLTAYDAAQAARQEGHRVHARGELVRDGSRADLLVQRKDFDVLG